MEPADVKLMSGHPRGIATAIALSKATSRRGVKPSDEIPALAEGARLKRLAPGYVTGRTSIERTDDYGSGELATRPDEVWSLDFVSDAAHPEVG